MTASRAYAQAAEPSNFFVAGKNKIINGDFRINQRGFSSTTINSTYGFDRWVLAFSTGTVTYSAQTFTPGAAPVAGYEAINFARIVTSGQTATTGFAGLYQKIEDVRTLAGQTVTISFWAKASSGTPKVQPTLEQNFGSGGSASVVTAGTSVTISTSWARYSATVTLPSLSGKTIGTGGGTLELQLYTSLGTSYPTYGDIGVQAATIDIWGVQVEAGSVATPFTTATGTLAGELAACQRYYQIVGGTSSGFPTIIGTNGTASDRNISNPISFPVKMRVSPTGTKNGTWDVSNAGQPTIVYITADGYALQTLATASSYFYAIPNSTDDTLTFSAEL